MQARHHASAAKTCPDLRHAAQAALLRACVLAQRFVGLEAKVRGLYGEDTVTKEEIMKLARAAGLIRTGDGWTEPHRWGLAEIEAFANLVAAAEREAIAQSLDKQADLAADEIDRQWAQEMAAAVRARGNT